VKSLTLSFLLFFASASSSQTAPDLRFNGHTLGESAETFFSTSTISELKAPTKEYCKTLLDDPNTLKNYEAQRAAVNKKEFFASYVSGCQQVMAALRREDASVGARYASELGKGNVLFVSGKLVAFNLMVSSSFADAIADMERRFGFPGRKYHSLQSVTGSEEMRWDAEDILAVIVKQPYTESVSIHLRQKQAALDFMARYHVPDLLAENTQQTKTFVLQHAPPAPPASQVPGRVSVAPGVVQGLLIFKVAPTYPPSAKENHIQGQVVLHAVIGKDGILRELTALSGPAALIESSMDAVRQWRYKPYFLNGESVDVETQITVNYQLKPEDMPTH
jgi:TonB family protein